MSDVSVDALFVRLEAGVFFLMYPRKGESVPAALGPTDPCRGVKPRRPSSYVSRRLLLTADKDIAD